MGLPLSWGVYKNRNEMEGLEAYENKGKGNPYHDKLGRFTTGPGGSKGASAKADKKKAEYDAEIAELSTFAGVSGNDSDIKRIAKRYDKDPADVAQDIDDYQALKEADRLGRTGGRAESSKGGEKGKDEKRKDYKAEQEGVDIRDGHRIGTEFADLERELGNARTNLKMLQKDKETAYTDLAARSRYLDRSSAIARTLAQATNFGKASKETKKLVKEMAKELKDIYDEYVDLGTKKYFDPDLNEER